MTDETRAFWTFINSFAEWFSALTTAAAVVVALYLSRRDDPKLRVSAGLRFLIQTATPRQEIVSVQVVNVGGRPALVETLHWRVGLFRRRLFFWMAPADFGSDRLPIRLEEGQRANYLMAAERMPELFTPIAQNLTRSWIRRRFAPVRVLATTSTGQTFSRRIEQDLRERIVGLVNARL